MDAMSKQAARPWLARATSQFARTVYAELRRAGHGKGDIVRFINELMDLLSRDGDQAGDVAQPPLVDPEAGLPGADAMQDIIEFELRIRRRDRRQDEHLVLVAIDLTIPQWTTSTARQRTHDVVAEVFGGSLRQGDTLGQLGPDRYLLVLSRAKEAVRGSLRDRISRALERRADSLCEGLRIELRFASIIAAVNEEVTAVEALQRCFAAAPEALELRAPSRTPTALRVANTIAGHEVVLALGGGAARAVSHVGVLEVLRDANIKVVGASGCSAGAIVGAMVASGMTTEAIAARFAALATTPLFSEMRRTYAHFLRDARAERSRSRYSGPTSIAFYSDTVLSALSDEHLRAFVSHFVPKDCDIASLAMPFSVVATDLAEGRSVRLAHGSLHEALAATCAVPGLFPPQRQGGRVLVDGGMITEVPIWAAHMLGLAAPVLAIHIGRPFHRVDDFQTSTEVSTRTNALVHAELVREQLRRADLLLSVPMEDIGWLEFRHAKRSVEIGRNAASAELSRLLAKLDVPAEA